ncbi:MAG: hypothetical protein H0W90_10565 [Actinobacteria bacterium]|nr:hypothetical protein [Actinomycetota bacterium]
MRAEALRRELERPIGHRRPRGLVFVIAAAAAAALVTVPALAVTTDLFGLLGDGGTPVPTTEFGNEDQQMMRTDAGGNWTVREIGGNGRIAFYLIKKKDMVCLASGRDRLPRSFGSTSFPAPPLPTAARPLYKEVAVATSGPGSTIITGAYGLAADAIGGQSGEGKRQCARILPCRRPRLGVERPQPQCQCWDP